MPLGSWILLRGSEKKAIISQLAEVYDLNADLTKVAQQQIPDKGGYLRKVICFFIADTKAQVILGGCSSFTAKNPAATVCWLCGKNRATILHEFGCGMGVIVEEWLWAGMAPSSYPSSPLPTPPRWRSVPGSEWDPGTIAPTSRPFPFSTDAPCGGCSQGLKAHCALAGAHHAAHSRGAAGRGARSGRSP